MKRISVDFNDVDGDLVYTSVDNPGADQLLNDGELVELHEGRSVTCRAHLVARTDHLLTFRVLWPTWRENDVAVS